jgi:hypothetical protein
VSNAAESKIIFCPAKTLYDVEEDLLVLEQPQECWTIGYNTEPDSSTLLPFLTEDTYSASWSSTISSDSGVDYLGAGPAGPNYAGVLRNPTESTFIPYYGNTFGGTKSSILGDSLLVNPDPTRTTYLRWTAPTIKSCTFSFDFFGASFYRSLYTGEPTGSGENALTVSMYHNNVLVESAELFGYLSSVSLGFSADVAGGDTIDIVSESYSSAEDDSGYGDNDWTQVSGSVLCVDLDEVDTGESDTGGVDTGSSDTGGVDTGSSDTGGVDTGSSDTAGDDGDEPDAETSDTSDSSSGE